MPGAPTRAEASTTQQQPNIGGKGGAINRNPGRVRALARPTNKRPASSSATTKEAPTKQAPHGVTAWFTSTVYDLGLSGNPLMPPTMERTAAMEAGPNKPGRVMAGQWAANLPPPAAEPQQARPRSADAARGHRAMMMLMDGRAASVGRGAKGDMMGKNEMGRTHPRHGAPPRAPPPMYKQQPMSRAQRTFQGERGARSSMGASRS